ncbi:hypothetical protein O2W18_00465 [Modestobacter sp. VKM Ac-2983]|uniref:hypothetical protein n=1 Tax=Modestobacter sp. VKM Ac-2983 TaxID=3004137 RepID=UPI0022AB78ED|nr:hypothetical protein [Modestobacter sp. VKM Ac-2983]MCZ2803573.1 hypothetical protein [Modestobacter sp. VKM Ac-2983]
MTTADNEVVSASPATAGDLRPVDGLLMAARGSWWRARAFCGRPLSIDPVDMDTGKPATPSWGTLWLRAAWRVWEPLAWPGYWLLHLGVVGAEGPAVVVVGRAAGVVPNPVSRSRRN